MSRAPPMARRGARDAYRVPARGGPARRAVGGRLPDIRVRRRQPRAVEPSGRRLVYIVGRVTDETYSKRRLSGSTAHLG